MTTLNNSLATQYIEPVANEEEAYLEGYNVPVWALIGYLHAAGGDAARVAADYDLPEAAVATAQRYYRQHQAQIDARSAANAALEDHSGIRGSHAA